MPRFCICKVIGDGVTPETAFRPSIVDVCGPDGKSVFNTMILCATDRGVPIHDWCLVLAAGDFSLVNGHHDIDLLPDTSLDIKLSDIGQATSDMDAKLAARGIARGAATDLRGVVKALGAIHDPTFDERAMRVVE